MNVSPMHSSGSPLTQPAEAWERIIAERQEGGRGGGRHDEGDAWESGGKTKNRCVPHVRDARAYRGGDGKGTCMVERCGGAMPPLRISDSP
jgi:hypothetical protein